MSIIFGALTIAIFFGLLYWLQQANKSLDSEETFLFKCLLFIIFICLFILTIYVNFAKYNFFSALINIFDMTLEFLRGLFNSDDKLKFLFQNDTKIVGFLFGVFGLLIVVALGLAGTCIGLAIISLFLAYLICLPCRYFYLLLWGDKSIIRNARANSEIFKFFEFVIWGLVALIILLIYLKVKNSYLSS